MQASKMGTGSSNKTPYEMWADRLDLLTSSLGIKSISVTSEQQGKDAFFDLVSKAISSGSSGSQPNTNTGLPSSWKSKNYTVVTNSKNLAIQLDSLPSDPESVVAVFNGFFISKGINLSVSNGIVYITDIGFDWEVNDVILIKYI